MGGQTETSGGALCRGQQHCLRRGRAYGGAASSSNTIQEGVRASHLPPKMQPRHYPYADSQLHRCAYGEELRAAGGEERTVALRHHRQSRGAAHYSHTEPSRGIQRTEACGWHSGWKNPSGALRPVLLFA